MPSGLKQGKSAVRAYRERERAAWESFGSIRGWRRTRGGGERVTIEEQAKNALSFFKSVNRRSESIWRLKDGTPKWVRDLVFKAHESGQILPNDYRYAYIVESLRLIGEGEEEPEFEAD